MTKSDRCRWEPMKNKLLENLCSPFEKPSHKPWESLGCFILKFASD